jgi:rhamnogalacturonan endolyase
MLASAVLMPVTPLFGAFGVVTDAKFHTVDTGAGLVFKIWKSNGGIDSIVFLGTELHWHGKDSGINSGLGSDGTTTSVSSNTDPIVITVATGLSNAVVAGLTHYYIVRKGENTIYMATFATNEPANGELRWITRLNAELFPDVPVWSDIRKNTGAIESTDVFGMADGTARSKYYGNQEARIWESAGSKAADMACSWSMEAARVPRAARFSATSRIRRDPRPKFTTT